jgi:hypothetical protein
MKIFKEEQRFLQPLIVIGLSIGILAVIIPIITDWNEIIHQSFIKNLSIFSGFIIIVVVFILFLYIKLKTRIDEKGIYYQFFPFQWNSKFIPWKNIDKCYIRKYNAITEFGGWGMKFSFRKNIGKSVTTKGNIGLQLELKNGKKILIGTQKKEELERTILNYQHKIIHYEN